MKKVNYNQFLTEATEALANNGAFLTVQSQKGLNTMTIGWANIGYLWGEPMIIVAVRKSRYTYQIIKDSEEFTVSIPFDNKMKEELQYCGTRSGINYNKFKECNLVKISSQNINTPFIKGCNLHYECEIKYNQQMNIKKLDRELEKTYYQDNDYHTLYFGEILNCFKEE
jgi:flavin reductase (DIM6/NTAB) family NADH-FMN oxidoreductase RutF